MGRSFFGAFAIVSSDSMPFEIRAATSVADYLFLRRVRNQVRREMTNDTAPIGYFRQLRFYLSRQPNLAVYICSTDQGLAGYLMLQKAS